VHLTEPKTEPSPSTQLRRVMLGGSLRSPLAVSCLLVTLILADSVLAADFKAGFAVADITPPVGWRRAGGYSEVISTGVNDPLMAKAMVVEDGATAFAFVGNDLCSVPRALTDIARAKASHLTGIPVANVVITATHTHGGPEYTGRCATFSTPVH
jgi:neutral ceramidase